MKRLTIIVSVLVALSIMLAACQPAATQPPATEPPATEPIVTEPPVVEPAAPTEFPRGETLYVSGAAWGPASTWNPFQPGSLANTTGTIGYVYEFLFSFDPLTGEFIPWLAESGDWADATTYEVTLRDGLTWSDGQPLTSADVKFTFELGQQYAALWFSPLWRYLTGVEAVDDTHLKFTFTDPLYQEWGNYLYNLPIVPKHLWENRTEEEITTGANEKPIGSGAYLYLSNAEDRNIWERNENW
ncbi:MAG: ABC transporter substrate-binding protein, partial [Chloroflexota bacterium]